MNSRKSIHQLLVLPALVLVVMACKSPTSFPNGFEYIKAKGFERPMFGQVRSAGTVKNINDHLDPLLEVLKKSEMIREAKVLPTYIIYLEIGSSLPSQTISIAIGDDGIGVIQFGRKRAYLRSRELSEFAKAAFQKSEIVVH